LTLYRVYNLANGFFLCYSKKLMKKDAQIKEYRSVIFLDTSSGKKFLIPSTIETKETGKWEDGKTYPQHKVEISSASHPFYTGQEKILDTAGRVEKFKIRRAAATKPPSDKKKISKKSK